jgi:glutamate formiminotransferase
MEQQMKIIADAVNEIMRQTLADRDEIERLRKSLKIFADNVNETNVGIDKDWAKTVYALKAENQRLLKALTNLYESCRWEKVCPTIDAAKDAITKATGSE